jgi:OOP family OmpA-OmpF porin
MMRTNEPMGAETQKPASGQRRRSLAAVLLAALAALSGAAGWPACAQDSTAADHPLVGRYPGAEIAYHHRAEFDEAALLQAPHDYASLLERNALDDRSGPEWLRREGRVTTIRYAIPAGRSSLEVLRNHEAALKAKGFTVVFQCVDRACFTGNLQDPYLLGQQLDKANYETTLYSGRVRYMLMHGTGPDGPTDVALLAGENNGQVTLFVTVVEARPMEGDRIAVLDADAMGTALESERRVNLYGIHFDHDEDVPRPESKPTLDEIARLLTNKPELRLQIVGHTDDRGSAAYNLDLSQRRAAGVVAVLTRDYGIAPERLKASGSGLTAPVAPNDSEEGRAKNRRVELVVQ